MKKVQSLLLLTLTITMLTGCLSGASKIYQVSTVSLPKEEVPPKLSNRDESVMVYSEWFARTYGFPLSGVDRTLPQGVEALELQIVVNNNDPLRVNKAYGYDVGTCYFNLMLKDLNPIASKYPSPPNGNRWYAKYRNRVSPFKGISPTIAKKYAYTTGIRGRYGDRTLSTPTPAFYGPHTGTYVVTESLTQAYCKRLSMNNKAGYLIINTAPGSQAHPTQIKVLTPPSFAHFITNRFLKN